MQNDVLKDKTRPRRSWGRFWLPKGAKKEPRRHPKRTQNRYPKMLHFATLISSSSGARKPPRGNLGQKLFSIYPSIQGSVLLNCTLVALILDSCCFLCFALLSLSLSLSLSLRMFRGSPLFILGVSSSLLCSSFGALLALVGAS